MHVCTYSVCNVCLCICLYTCVSMYTCVCTFVWRVFVCLCKIYKFKQILTRFCGIETMHSFNGTIIFHPPLKHISQTIQVSFVVKLQRVTLIHSPLKYASQTIFKKPYLFCSKASASYSYALLPVCCVLVWLPQACSPNETVWVLIELLCASNGIHCSHSTC